MIEAQMHYYMLAERAQQFRESKKTLTHLLSFYHATTMVWCQYNTSPLLMQ